MFSSKLPRGLKLTVFASLICAVILGALQTVVMLTSYEFDVMLYYRDAMLPYAVNIPLVAAVVLIALAVPLTTRGHTLPTKQARIGTVASFFGAIAAFLVFGAFAVEFYSYLILGNTPSTGIAAQQLFFIARIVFALPAGLYLLVISLGKRMSRNLNALLGFCLVMWLAMCLITTYFNMNSPLNSPPRVLCILAYTALMLTSLMAMRFGIDRPKAATWIAVSMIAVIFGAVSAFPPLVLTTLGRYSLDSSTMSYAAQLALTLYCAARVCEFGGEPEADEEISDAADETEADVGKPDNADGDANNQSTTNETEGSSK